MNKETIDLVIELLSAMTDEEWEQVMIHFCKHCGNPNPPCYCWNDE